MKVDYGGLLGAEDLRQMEIMESQL